MTTTGTAMFALSDRAVDALAEADPCRATSKGIAGHDHRLTDYSPEGIARREEIASGFVAEARSLLSEPELSDADRQAGEILLERLGGLLDLTEHGDYLREITVLTGAPHAIRNSLELMPDDLDAFEARLLAVPEALASWRRALSEGVRQSVVPARRQALVVAGQLDAIGSGWFSELASRRFPTQERLGDPAAAADEAYIACADWLRHEYSSSCREDDAVGEDTYRRHARAWLGGDVDLRQTYEWGWEELRSLTARMQQATRDLGAADLAEARQLLQTDPRYRIVGSDNLLAHLRQVTEDAISALDGIQFDIDPRIRTCEVRLAPEGSAAAPYYIAPSEDLTRPGSTWYPTQGKQDFPAWWLLSVWYHESVPGHHLQVATVLLESERLSRFQRQYGWTSGYGEGWALYAERLMDELGHFDDPGVRMGFLSTQAFRAARVVIDIGLHLGLRVPATAEVVPAGHRWTPDLARQMLVDTALLDPDFARSEVDRYLGLPGQAISYKVGERMWLEEREAARRRVGPDFDQKRWHMYALRAGHMGMAPFRQAMARFHG